MLPVLNFLFSILINLTILTFYYSTAGQRTLISVLEFYLILYNRSFLKYFLHQIRIIMPLRRFCSCFQFFLVSVLYELLLVLETVATQLESHPLEAEDNIAGRGTVQRLQLLLCNRKIFHSETERETGGNTHHHGPEFLGL